MRVCSRLLFCALLLASLTPLAFAQKKFCAKAPPSPFKHDGRIVTSFDRRAGGMRTTLEHPRALGRGADALYLAASFVHQDPRRPSIPTLELVLVSNSLQPKFSAGHNLSFVFDGQPRAFNQRVNYRAQSAGDGTIVESAAIRLSYADMASLTRARKVVARLGATEVEFSNNHLEALRELVSLLAPSPGRWQTDDRLSAR
jgi:hypothetical protein